MQFCPDRGKMVNYWTLFRLLSTVYRHGRIRNEGKTKVKNLILLFSRDFNPSNALNLVSNNNNYQIVDKKNNLAVFLYTEVQFNP